jgi:hypothetical protein
MAQTTATTRYPKATPEQLEANRIQRELIGLQTGLLKQQAGLAQKYLPQQQALLGAQLGQSQAQLGMAQRLAPAREELLTAQLAAGKEGLGLREQAMGAFKETLTPGQLQQDRETLREEVVRETLAKVKGEKPYISPEQEKRLADLEARYKTAGTEDIRTLAATLREEGTTQAEARGLRPSAGAYAKTEAEADIQVGKIGRAARALGLETGLNLRPQLQQELESQRQFGAGLQQQTEAARLDALLGATGMQGRAPTVSPMGAVQPGQGAQQPLGAGGYASPALQATINELTQMQQAGTSTTETYQKDRVGGGVAGAIQGAQIGMQVGSLVPGWGGVVAGIGLTIAGGIYGYNA